MIFAFMGFDINCCAECPLFYDCYRCELDDDLSFDDFTWNSEEGRPKKCKLFPVKSFRMKLNDSEVGNAVLRLE